MKNIIKLGALALLSFFIMTACDPQESTDYALGATPTSDQLDFTATPTNNKNIINIADASKIKGVATWDFGNGNKGKGENNQVTYPFKGNYTITMTLYTSGGSATITKTISILNDDYSLVNTPVYKNLTGGADNTAGETWVFDQYNNFVKEVATKTGFAITGHLGLGPNGSYGQSWWGAGPNEKSTWKMYNFEFNFIQIGVKLNIKNAGEGYGRKASASSVGGFTVSSVNGDDALFPYNGGDYTFSIDQSGKYPKIKLSGNAFMGYYCGSQEYEIIYQTDKVMALRVNNTVENSDWIFVYCLKELNVKPVVPLRAVALAEDYEGAKINVAFVPQDMGTHTFAGYSNPAPTGINTSSKVYLYEKSSAFYSNISYTATGYKLDLSTINKVHMKVFIPSYNDYTTVNSTAGSWILINQLQTQVAVKLQNNDLGGNAYTTQTEIDKTNLEKDKWLDLIFDFSSVKDRTDYDKIVIQFGAEGHSGPGIFFFDDFTFNK